MGAPVAGLVGIACVCAVVGLIQPEIAERPSSGPPASPVPMVPDRRAAPANDAHDFHVSYARMAVEGPSAAVRIRFFANDLLGAVRSFSGDDSLVLTDDPATWTPFAAWFRAGFVLRAVGDTLEASIIASGEEIMDKEPMRWFLIRFEAEEPIRSASLDNRLLFEAFDDQKNIVQFQHFPSEKRGSLYFTADRPFYEMTF